MPKNGSPARTRTTRNGVAIASGRRITARAMRAQKPWPCRASAATGLSSISRSDDGSGTRSRFTRCPSMPSSAGSTVRPNTSVERTVTTPPMPMLRRAADSKTIRLDSPMATLLPEAAHGEERVVDRQGQADHRGDVRDENAHLRHAGQQTDGGHRTRQRQGGDDDRQRRADQGAEHGEQDQHRDRQADHLAPDEVLLDRLVELVLHERDAGDDGFDAGGP